MAVVRRRILRGGGCLSGCPTSCCDGSRCCSCGGDDSILVVPRRNGGEDAGRAVASGGRRRGAVPSFGMIGGQILDGCGASAAAAAVDRALSSDMLVRVAKRRSTAERTGEGGRRRAPGFCARFFPASERGYLWQKEVRIARRCETTPRRERRAASPLEIEVARGARFLHAAAPVPFCNAHGAHGL